MYTLTVKLNSATHFQKLQSFLNKEKITFDEETETELEKALAYFSKPAKRVGRMKNSAIVNLVKKVRAKNVREKV